MGIVKTGLGLVFIGAVAFAGDYYNVNDKIFHPAQYQDKKVEQGYFSKPFELEKKIVVNSKGNLETYIVTLDQKLPVLQGKIGPQIGDSDYIWNNFPQEQKDTLFARGWSSMDEQKKMELAKPMLADLVGKFYTSFLGQLGLK